MSDATPLLYAVGFLLFIGLAVPFGLSFVIDTDDITATGLAAGLIDVVEDGFELDLVPFTDWGTLEINPFSWMGSTLQSYFVDSLTFLGALPLFLQVIILVLSFFAIVYTLIKMVPFS